MIMTCYLPQGRKKSQGVKIGQKLYKSLGPVAMQFVKDLEHDRQAKTVI